MTQLLPLALAEFGVTLPAVPDRGIVPLSRFTAALGRLRGRRRLEAILEHKEAAALVAEMSAVDLYFLIKEVGLADATELVELVTPDQFQALLDLDLWDADRLQDDDVRPWLAALVEAGPDKLAQTLEHLDPELTALLFQRWTRVYDQLPGQPGQEDELPDWEEPPFYATPDRFFLVKITAADPDTSGLVSRILDDLYRADASLARHILRSAMSEPPAELEEASLRFRSGRMQDLGFAERLDALEAYRPLAVDSVQVGEGTADKMVSSTLPALYAETSLRSGFFAQVVSGLNDVEESRRLEAALVTLLNRVLAADRVHPADIDAATKATARAAGTLSLGLETLSRGDLGRAQEALRTVALVRIHRLGHSVVLQLAKLASVLRERAELAEEPWSSVVRELGVERPLYALVLDDPPHPGSRPFRSVVDVRRATRAVAQLAVQTMLVFDLGRLDPQKLGPAHSLGDAGRTLLCRAALGLEPVVAPLREQDIRSFLGMSDPARRQAALSALVPLMSTPPEEFPAVFSGWMDDLTDLRRIENLITIRIR